MIYESPYYGISSTTGDELTHYGVLGMKWGVRRYQNYDGTYTRKGLQRYKTAEDEYKQKNAAYKEAKKQYKAGAIDKMALNKARNEKRAANGKLVKQYRNLKFDNRADKGKALYESNHSIRKNLDKSAVAGTALGLSNFVLATKLVNKRIPLGKGRSFILNDIGAVTAASALTLPVSIAYGVKLGRENAYMRAYNYRTKRADR